MEKKLIALNFDLETFEFILAINHKLISKEDREYIEAQMQLITNRLAVSLTTVEL